MSREGGGGKVCNVVLSARCGLQKPKTDKSRSDSVNLFGTLLSSRQHRPGQLSKPQSSNAPGLLSITEAPAIMPPYLDADQGIWSS